MQQIRQKTVCYATKLCIMKLRYFYLSFVFFISLGLSSQAQVIKGAVFGGLNLTQVEGDEVFGFKRPGAHVGAAAILPFTDRWSLTLETLYSMEGAFQRATQDEQWVETMVDPVTGERLNPYNEDRFMINGAYNLHLNYVRIPLIFHYNDRALALGVGFQYGRLVGVKEVEQHIYDMTSVADTAYKKNDYNVLVDARVRLYKGLFFNVRWSYSLANIRERTFYNIYSTETFNRKQFNHALTFRLMWIINDGKKSLKTQGKETMPY